MIYGASASQSEPIMGFASVPLPQYLDIPTAHKSLSWHLLGPGLDCCKRSVSIIQLGYKPASLNPRHFIKDKTIGAAELRELRPETRLVRVLELMQTCFKVIELNLVNKVYVNQLTD